MEWGGSIGGFFIHVYGRWIWEVLWLDGFKAINIGCVVIGWERRH